MTSMLFFLVFVFINNDAANSYEDDAIYYVSFLWCVALMINQLNVEFSQAHRMGLLKYASSFWNWIDLSGLMMVTLLLLSLWFHFLSTTTEQIFAAFFILTLFLKINDWLRLFDTTGFYIELI